MAGKRPIIERIYVVERVWGRNLSPGRVFKLRVLGCPRIIANEFPIGIEVQCEPLISLHASNNSKECRKKNNDDASLWMRRTGLRPPAPEDNHVLLVSWMAQL